MSYRDIRCQECSVAMESGFLIDRGQGGEEKQSEWHPGEVQYRTFLGLKFTIKIDRSRKLKIVTYRCPKCGVLRSYAQSDEWKLS